MINTNNASMLSAADLRKIERGLERPKNITEALILRGAQAELTDRDEEPAIAILERENEDLREENEWQSGKIEELKDEREDMREDICELKNKLSLAGHSAALDIVSDILGR